MALRVAVDFGTSSTCVAVSVNGREPQVVAVDGRPVLSSAVYASPDGRLFVGLEAERQAAVDPSRYEPNPKRRVDEPELLLGNKVVPVVEAIRAVLGRAVEEARRFGGGAPVGQLVLTHPADWGGIRTRVLRQAANGLSERIALVPEPVAAAVFHADTFAGRAEAIAVLDIGGGTVDVSVVGRAPGPGHEFRVLATKGDPSFGGADVDQALLQHVGRMVSATDPDGWRSLIEGRELSDRRRRRVVAQDVQGAKETLSRHTYTDVPMPDPFADAHVTRQDLEQLVAAPLGRAVELAAAAIRDAGVRADHVFLVGGSSRIPMVARLVHERIGIVPTTLDQPETVVARGALKAVRGEVRRSPVQAVSDRTVPVRTTAAPPRFPRPQPVQPPPRPVPPPPPRQFASPPPPAKRGTKPWILGGAAAIVVAAVVVVLVLTSGGGEPAREQPSGRTIAQFDYTFTMPQDWKQVASDTAYREVRVKPSDAEQGLDAIIVQELALAFDPAADRERAVGGLREKYKQSTNLRLSDLNENGRFADRDVVTYRQQVDNATVEWFVLFDKRAQVSIGCEYTPSGRDRVMAACDQVVRSMTVN
ncbi:type VII secretion-associated protein [Kibdelosporangium phytohabitans]|uniref:Molecular chaperone n=1 Tax=Kibdelosporangium phytohabitans TaxID=860235 RepID=A0A0N9IG75_9PSEU|nr:type VII secretion-associated protein [Kibdelosporangium phytohabitans]ALG13849.1 molecular chaperone [Kibdelosporangium phytohabitans]MBE1467221.1 type VII secretion-associated protein (TIGR03931 family) [Kibdelosporangium phytohabitans]